MKKILITGITSYVGTSFKKYLGDFPESYLIDTISLKGEFWKEKNFSQYDVILHVAGIAHVSTDIKLKEMYYKVNRDLTIEVANKAKLEGVKQFIFMSSIIVYGDSSSNSKVIKRSSIPTPSNFYGDSKLQAENGIKNITDDTFKVAIIRPPMIYGKGSKGNYPRLAKIARYTPIFPEYNNQRSMLHIDNLCEFLRLVIENEESGIFFPQNKEYVSTSELVKHVGIVHGRKIKFIKFLNPLIKIIGVKIKVVQKVFGNLVYDQEISEYKERYQVRNFVETIKLTEK